MSNQLSTVKVSVNSYMRKKAFRIGVADYKDSRPRREEWQLRDDRLDSYIYEVGRQFAALFPDWTEKQLRPIEGKVNVLAQRDLLHGVSMGWICKSQLTCDTVIYCYNIEIWFLGGGFF